MVPGKILAVRRNVAAGKKPASATPRKNLATTRPPYVDTSPINV
jgi:hypothetical protein